MGEKRNYCIFIKAELLPLVTQELDPVFIHRRLHELAIRDGKQLHTHMQEAAENCPRKFHKYYQFRLTFKLY